MSHEIHANYKQNFILPPELENWVPLTHPARFIRAFVDEQNLAALGFKQRKGNVGAPNYSANLLVKIFLYGYFHKIRPLRALEHACYNDMGMIWLTGNKHPDHNTLNRFFRNNRKAFGKLFKKSIFKGIEMNLVELALVAVDGTRILSNVKRSKLISRNETREPNRLITSSVGLAIPVDPEQVGYLTEHHDFGKTEKFVGDYVEDLAATMLATSLGLEIDLDKSWNEKKVFRPVYGRR